MKRAAQIGTGIVVVACVIAAGYVYARKRREHAGYRCINTMRQIYGEKARLAWKYSLTNGTRIAWEDIVGTGPSASWTNWMFCPHDRSRSYTNSYEFGLIGEPPRCRICPDEHVCPPQNYKPPKPTPRWPIAVTEGFILGQKGTQFLYRSRCSDCGHVDPHDMATGIPEGSAVHTNEYICEGCGSKQTLTISAR